MAEGKRNVAREMARRHHVSERTIYRDSRLARAMDIAEQKVGAECVQKVGLDVPKGHWERICDWPAAKLRSALTRIGNGEHYRDVLGVVCPKHQEATILRLWRSLSQRRQAALLQTLLRNLRVRDGGD